MATANARFGAKAGADATMWFPQIASALSMVGGGLHILDGEVVVLDEAGRLCYDKLHERARRKRWYAGAPSVVYAVFDCLQCNDDPILSRPLIERKASMLACLGMKRPGIMPVGHFEGSAE